MILSEKIEITLNPANIKHFNLLGYKDLKRGNKLVVPIEHLNNGSNYLVNVQCDICGTKKEIKYRFYLKNIKNQGYYSCCEKCSRKKASITSMNNYGIEHFTNLDKFKITCLENYGVENPSQVEKVKEKRKNTMLKKYNVEYYVLSDDFQIKSEKTSIINYGTSHPMMSDKMKEIKKKYFLSMGFNVTTNNFELYKIKVYRLTRKNKKELLKNWNGYDYYDNEYIKNNFNLPGSHKDYPTIDHKFSIFEGYKNNIDAEEISKIENLCFTKRFLNSKKYTKNSI